MRVTPFLKGFFFILFFSLHHSLNAKKTPKIEGSGSSEQKFEKLSYDPTTGDLRVSHISTCGTVDKIPWSIKSNGKRIRRIFRDYLKKDGDKTYFLWELSQVLGDRGEVTFVFQKKLKDNRSEFYAMRGTEVERVLEFRKGRKRLIDKQNMKPLINRVGAVFLHKDGSRVEFIPGQTGKSAVIVYPTDANGVGIAPVYLKNMACDKPESFKDEDIVEYIKRKDSGGGAPAPGATPAK